MSRAGSYLLSLLPGVLFRNKWLINHERTETTLKLHDTGVLSHEAVSVGMFGVSSLLKLQSVVADVRDESSSTRTGNYHVVDITEMQALCSVCSLADIKDAVFKQFPFSFPYPFPFHMFLWFP